MAAPRSPPTTSMRFVAAPRARDARVHRGSVARPRDARHGGDRARAHARVSRALPGRRAPARGRAALHARYGFRRWPALVVLSDGKHVGAVDGLRNWDEYVKEVARAARDGAEAAADDRHTRQDCGRGRTRLRFLKPLRQGPLMKTLSIPVRVVGPGSQPEEESLAIPGHPARHEHVPDAARAGARRSRGVVRGARHAAGIPRGARALGPRHGSSRPADRHRRAVAGRRSKSSTRCWARARSASRSTARARRTSRRACSRASGACASSMRTERLIGDWIEAAPLPAIVLEAARRRGGAVAGAGRHARRRDELARAACRDRRADAARGNPATRRTSSISRCFR